MLAVVNRAEALCDLVRVLRREARAWRSR